MIEVEVVALGGGGKGSGGAGRGRRGAVVASRASMNSSKAYPVATNSSQKSGPVFSHMSTLTEFDLS